MRNCKECGWELDNIGNGRYRCTNPDCALSGKDLDKDGNPLAIPPPKVEVVEETKEIEKRLSISKIEPIAKRLLPYLVATLDWERNPEWKKNGVYGNPPRCFDPWFLDDVCVNSGLEAGDIEYFCRILKPSAQLEEISCEYSTTNRPYRFRKKRLALSPAFVGYLESRSHEREEFSKKGIDMVRAYFLLAGEGDPFDSLAKQFDDDHWKWVIGKLKKCHYSYPRLHRKGESAIQGAEEEGLTLFQADRFYLFGDHFFGAGGREIGPPKGEATSTFASSPAFFDSISGLKPRELALQLKERLPKYLEDLRRHESSLLSVQESFDKGKFRKDTEYDPEVLEELQEKGIIDLENGLVIPSPSFSEYTLGGLMVEKETEIARELKNWLDIPES